MSNEIKTRPLTLTEQKYTYAQSMQLEGQTGTIGHLRGDFATTGYGFYATWFDTRPQWKSDEFKADLDTVINALREDKGLLHNRYDMSAFARHFPESAIKGNYCTEYGFRVDTEKHAFLLRCNPTKGDYNFYCYCYVKEQQIGVFGTMLLAIWLCIAMKQPKNLCNINHSDVRSLTALAYVFVLLATVEITFSSKFLAIIVLLYGIKMQRIREGEIAE